MPAQFTRFARRSVPALAAIAAVTLAGAALSAAGPAQAAYLGSNGLIAFVRHGDIYTINPQGAHPAATIKRLTSDGHASGPRWAPSGRKLAFLDRGNLWIMNPNGSHKVRITDQAPAYTDSRPTWSPNGRYLAFVKTKKGAGFGVLTRYNMATHRFVTFTTRLGGKQVAVTALPAAVAWTRAINAGSTFGSFIIFEGATAPRCALGKFCLDALGFAFPAEFRNGFPSSENITTAPIRQLDPDWFPINPEFNTNVLTTRAKCIAGHCTPLGIDLIPGSASVVLPGAYQAVYSPNGNDIAFVRIMHRVPEIFIDRQVAIAPLTAGTEPDWQPVSPFPPS